MWTRRRRLMRCCLSAPPETLPAHEVLCFADVDTLRARLHPCPRPSLERALRYPQVRPPAPWPPSAAFPSLTFGFEPMGVRTVCSQTASQSVHTDRRLTKSRAWKHSGAWRGGRQGVLQCRCCPPGGGLSAKLPDTAACYVLMDRQGEFIDVHQWFAAFAALHPAPRQSAITNFFAQENATSPAGKRKERARPAAAAAGAPTLALRLLQRGADGLGFREGWLGAVGAGNSNSRGSDGCPNAHSCQAAADSCEPAE